MNSFDQARINLASAASSKKVSPVLAVRLLKSINHDEACHKAEANHRVTHPFVVSNKSR